jgi:sterol desaturase/sphingolipid hydroxylase (fatty acid hydroxylase superfamily)
VHDPAEVGRERVSRMDARAWISTANFEALLFPAAFLLVALWESLRPARAETIAMSLRWFGNIVLFLLSWIIATLLPFITGLGAALLARQHGWGLLNAFATPAAVSIPLSFVALDLFAYWEHRLFHAVPVMWRLHALHHSDPDLDVTTTVRHHPFEVVLQLLFDAVAAMVCGFPPAAIALYGLIVTVNQTVQHGNIEWPKALRWIGNLIVTPEVHRIHHSMAFDENNSNFSSLLIVWDRVFGTLRLRSHEQFRLGLAEFAAAESQRLDRLLATPWLVPRAQILVSRTGNIP